jgi:uncharacterized protein (TIGR03118 family)
MKLINKPSTVLTVKSFCFLLLSVTMVFAIGCNKFKEPKALKNFSQVNLVANKDGYGASHIDPALLNAWGLAFSSTGTPWVNSTGGHVSAVYDKEGAFIAARPAVNIPSPKDTIGGLPTGIVFSGSATDFLLANTKPARFIFVGVDGILSAWNAGNNAQVVHNNSTTSAYTGLTLAVKDGANYLYAANFKAGRIDVWDKSFAKVAMTFKDNHIPNGFSPFNIQAVGSLLYVTYAKVGPDGKDEKGYGNGFVDVFSTNGSLVKRFAERGSLNSPWGLALAPASFFGDTENDDHGKSNSGGDNSGPGNSGDNGGHGNSGGGSDNSGHGNGSGSGIEGPDDQNIILVGNFGDGHINAYRENGNFIGQLVTHGKPVIISGLWSLQFPPVTATAVDPNRLYFTAGPAQESDGLFGYLIKQ